MQLEQLELFFEKEEYNHVSGKTTQMPYKYYSDYYVDEDSNWKWQVYCINKNYYGYLEALYGEQFNMFTMRDSTNEVHQ